MPATMSDSDQNISRTQLRIETPLKERAEVLAKRRRMSFNAYVCAAVEAAVLRDEKRLQEEGTLGGGLYSINPHSASTCADH
jgi:hypothetical protein